MGKASSFRQFVAAIMLLSVTSCASSFVYMPNRRITGTPSNAGLDYEPITIVTRDKVRISAWWIPGEARGALVYCHGNAGNMSGHLEQLRALHGLGVSILCFDYRGYGDSEGTPSENGTAMDAQAALDWCVSVKKIPTKEAVIYGHSLGGAIAIRLASENSVGGVIVDSSFTSIYDVGKRSVPSVLAWTVVGNMYNSSEQIQRVRCPVLVMHSRHDEIIDYSMGQELYAAANEPKYFVQLRGSHNSSFRDSGDAWREEIGRFIERHLLRSVTLTGREAP